MSGGSGSPPAWTPAPPPYTASSNPSPTSPKPSGCKPSRKEGRRRAQLELKTKERTAADQQQTLDLRSHVLSLREGELDSRMRDRETTIAALNLQLRELTVMLRKEQATREAQARRIAAQEAAALPSSAVPAHPRTRLAPRNRRAPTNQQRTEPLDNHPKKPPNTGTLRTSKKKPPTRRAGKLRRSTTTPTKRTPVRGRPPPKGKRR